MGYEEAAALAQHRSLSDLRRALRQFAPLAKSEYAWGAVDAWPMNCTNGMGKPCSLIGA